MSLMAVGVGAAVAGTLLSGVSMFSQAQAQGAAASYQSQVAANNAKIAEQNAQYSIAAGQTKAQQDSLQNAQRVGAIISSQAANNVDVNTGSAKEVQISQRETGKLTAENDVNNALLQAYGYRSQGAGFNAQSQLESGIAGQTGMAELGAAGSTLLQGAKALPSGWFTDTPKSDAGQSISDHGGN